MVVSLRCCCPDERRHLSRFLNTRSTALKAKCNRVFERMNCECVWSHKASTKKERRKRANEYPDNEKEFPFFSRSETDGDPRDFEVLSLENSPRESLYSIPFPSLRQTQQNQSSCRPKEPF
jgi:hypothetical protein